VADLFESAVMPPGNLIVGQAPGAAGHAGFQLDLDVLAENLASVTKREDVPEQSALITLDIKDLQGEIRSFPNFSVEMETGTGKTYVLVATALRLAETHGFRKFVILVHSVAIRANLVSELERSYEHFRAKFPAVPYTWGVLGEGTAAEDLTEPSSTVRFLVASVQSIQNPESNTVYRQPEQPQLWGEAATGMNSIAAARPVVIIDEPQNMATEGRRRAIATLNPLVVLRYSATHREPFNLVHRLGPKAATEAGLVKRVAVKGVTAGRGAEPYLHVKRLRSKNRRLFAEVVIDHSTKYGRRRQEVVLQNGSDLFDESGGLDEYRSLVVDRFERKPDRVVFEGGRTLHVGEEAGVDREAVWRDQLRHTIRQHLARQEQVDATGRRVKVLSLFFVERVADYVGDEAVLPVMFDELYRDEWRNLYGTVDGCPNPAALRVHYFPSTKTGILKDTNNTVSDAEFEARAYDAIIADKMKMLDRDNPWAFIFSHSALKEGWDNPNVFQVGFLRHTRSDLERRQQIGRGLRLPLDDTCHRVRDPEVCRLTLVVDESFAEFRDGLNKEYAAAGGDSNGPEPDDLDKQVKIERRSAKYESDEFKAMWQRIRYRARYRVTLDPGVLPEAVAESEHLDDLRYLAKRGNLVQEAELVYDEAGKVVTKDDVVAEHRGHALSVVGRRLPNLVRLVEDQLLATKYPLRLTRPTVAAIIGALPGWATARALDDPERWTRIVAHAIRAVTIERMVGHIGYELEPETGWWDAEVVFLKEEDVVPPAEVDGATSKRGVKKAAVGGPNLFDHTVYDSDVERKFSDLLDNDTNVRLFTKLPRRFSIRTPVGDYSPDWAVVYDADGLTRLYLVRETKGTSNLDDLDWDEAMRIRFAKKHFAAAPTADVHYTHSDGSSIVVDFDGQAG
jgi:type III restriction enzyme